MAVRNLRNIVLVHLAWSLWAFSYTYVQGSLTLTKLFIETFIGPAAGLVLSAADATVFTDRLKQVRFFVVFVVCCGERCGVRRGACRRTARRSSRWRSSCAPCSWPWPRGTTCRSGGTSGRCCGRCCSRCACRCEVRRLLLAAATRPKHRALQ